jgi:antitoxin Phd
MKTWPVQDAKARFSELLETCLREGPQLVTRRGEKAAVLVPAEEWENLNRARQPTLKELLLADSPRGELNIPPRGRLRRRRPPTF